MKNPKKKSIRNVILLYAMSKVNSCYCKTKQSYSQRFNKKSDVWNCVHQLLLCSNTEHLMVWYFRDTFVNFKFVFNRDLSRKFGIPISSFSPSAQEIHFQKVFLRELAIHSLEIIISWVRSVSTNTCNW